MMSNYTNTRDCRFLPFQRFFVDPMNNHSKVTSMMHHPDICSSGNIVNFSQVFIIDSYAFSMCENSVFLSGNYICQGECSLISFLKAEDSTVDSGSM